MKFRSNQLQTRYNLEVQDIYLKQFLAAVVQSQDNEQHGAEQSATRYQKSAAGRPVKASSASSINKPSVNTNTMKSKSSSSAACSNLNSVSGLNNLGNSCFFNAVLQNIAQTPYLVDLLKENFTTQNKPFLIRHNSEFDSELDEDEETAGAEAKLSSAKSKESVTAGGDSDSSDLDLISNGDGGDESKGAGDSPRSMRLNELRILVKESSGPLTRQLYETIKSMTSVRTTVNPSPLFGQICKKIPSYKGFQQQDSHELLINLLDSVKTEELKRRQAGILEALRVNPKSLDDLAKRKIKRYGRLASYTFVDKLFGGHLLSSVVCEECKTCSHRIEPFLDLSLPIVDESAVKQGSLMSTLAQTGSNKIANVGSTFQKARGKLKTISKDLAASADPAAAFRKDSNASADNGNEKPLSKHQLKKQKKTAKKTKVGRLLAQSLLVHEGAQLAHGLLFQRNKGQRGKDDDEAEENETDALKEAMCKLEITDKGKEEAEEAESKTTVESSLNGGFEPDEASKAEHDDNDDIVVPTSKDSGKGSSELEQQSLAENGAEADEQDDSDDNEDDREYKFLNTFRLEAMKNAKSSADLGDESGCSIQLCLAKFTANERLREKLSCDFCTSRLNPHHGTKSKTGAKNSGAKKQESVYTPALKQYLICELPAVLIIHLKRFQQHGYRLEKSNKHVSFPLQLDMSPYTSKMCVNLFTSRRQSTPQTLYSLYGLVEHSGRLNSGHYTAYVKANPKPGFHQDQTAFLGSQRICHLKSMLKRWNGKSLAPRSIDEELLSQEDIYNQYLDLESNQADEEDEESSATATGNMEQVEDKWYHISDSSVSEVSVTKVLKAQAYLLFYERVQ